MTPLRSLPLACALIASCLPAADLRLGMIGTDTGHVVEFTKVLHDPKAPAPLAGVRIVGAVPSSSRDIESSWTKSPGYVEKLQHDFGVKMHESLETLLPQVDGMLVESVDGRPHLAQAAAIIRAGKPCYIEKPVAISLRDALEIFTLARRHRVPVFSSSALRFGRATQAVRLGSIGRVQSAETSSPAPLEPNHPDLFWYGVHGVESLFTVMGTGWESARRTSGPGALIVTEGQWNGGRRGVFREVARGKLEATYVGRAVGDKGEAAVAQFEGYAPLVVAIVEFFRTGRPPVSARETLEIIAFMEADALSKSWGGAPVTLAEVLARAGWQGAWPGDF